MTDENAARVLRILERLVDTDDQALIARIEALETWQTEVEAVWPQITEGQPNGTS